MSSHALVELFEHPLSTASFSHAYLVYGFQHPSLLDEVDALILSYFRDHTSVNIESDNFFQNSPDIYRVIPEGASIKIADIKQLQERIKYGAYADHYLFVIIPNCDLLTSEAANAFLKTLEEPRDNIVFFLVTEHVNQLLPTIHSRCQPVFVPSPDILPPQDDLFISFDAFMKLSLLDKLNHCASLALNKPIAKEHLSFWVRETSDIQWQTIVLDTLRHFQFNVNLRLQLDAMVFRLSTS